MVCSYVRRQIDVAAGGDTLKEVDQNALLCVTVLLHLCVFGGVCANAFSFVYYSQLG